ncbi:MAG: helix-turn-helix transcriptional regulator [Saprospiraceae bacterium]
MEILSLPTTGLLQTDSVRVEHREIVLGEHARLDLTLAKSAGGPIQIERVFQNPDRMAGLHYCLNGNSSLTQGNHVPGARFNDTNCNLMLIQPHRTNQVMEFEGNFSLASFYIDLHHFAALLGPEFDRLPTGFVRSAGLGNKCSCTTFRWTPRAYSAISQLINSRFTGMASRIFLESKLLELVALMLDTQAPGKSRASNLHPRDVEKIHYAKSILLADAANPPSLARLARLAGTNEFLLKKGFRELFGMPVYRLLQKHRMEQALELLKSDRTKSVAEVALEVGYDDHSAFSRAFANFFGQPPSVLRGECSGSI